MGLIENPRPECRMCRIEFYRQIHEEPYFVDYKCSDCGRTLRIRAMGGNEVRSFYVDKIDGYVASHAAEEEHRRAIDELMNGDGR